MHVNMIVSVSAVTTIRRHDVIAMQWFSHKVQAMNNFIFRIIFWAVANKDTIKLLTSPMLDVII